jgi:hypothetical protein
MGWPNPEQHRPLVGDRLVWLRTGYHGARCVVDRVEDSDDQRVYPWTAWVRWIEHGVVMPTGTYVFWEDFYEGRVRLEDGDATEA